MASFVQNIFHKVSETNQFQNSGNNKKNSSRNTKKIKKDRKYQYKPQKKTNTKQRKYINLKKINKQIPVSAHFYDLKKTNLYRR